MFGDNIRSFMKKWIGKKSFGPYGIGDIRWGKMRIELMIDSTLIEKKNCKFGKIAVRKMAFLRSAIERLEVVGFCDDFILSSSQSKY
jgi:hypothetical protein